MSASAIANKIQYQDAFANKKLQQQQPKQHDSGALNSHPSSSSDININKVRLEDPFNHNDNNDSNAYLSNATYKPTEDKEDNAVDEHSIYSTPIGKSQVEKTAADTPLPPSATATQKNYNAPSKESDDYDKVVKVIHDHISKELPKMPESKSVEGEKQDCCRGHKAKSAAAVQEKVAEQESTIKEKATTGESEGSGKEEKDDEGDDTVIVTLKGEFQSYQNYFATERLSVVEELGC